MFTIPSELITKVSNGERFFCSSIGHGLASLGGTKVVIKVPSEGRHLGERFIATGNNRLIPEAVAHLLAAPPKELSSKQVFTHKKLPKRTFRKRK